MTLQLKGGINTERGQVCSYSTLITARRTDKVRERERGTPIVSPESVNLTRCAHGEVETEGEGGVDAVNTHTAIRAQGMETCKE